MTMLGGKRHETAPTTKSGTSAEPWLDEFGGIKGSTKAPDWIDKLPF